MHITHLAIYCCQQGWQSFRRYSIMNQPCAICAPRAIVAPFSKVEQGKTEYVLAHAAADDCVTSLTCEDETETGPRKSNSLLLRSTYQQTKSKTKLCFARYCITSTFQLSAI